MCEEFDFIYCNKTWQLVDLPQRQENHFCQMGLQVETYR